MRGIRAVAIIMLATLGVACFNEDGAPRTAAESVSPPAAAPSAPPPEPGPPPPGAPPAPPPAPGAAPKPMRDGEFDVGDGNKVAIDVVGAGINLGAVTPGPGWTPVRDDVDINDVDIDFRRPGEKRSFSADLERGFLQVEIGRDITPAQPGNFAVGEAGSVDVGTGPGITVTATERPNEGWGVFRKADLDGDEIDLIFTRANEQYKLKVDRNSFGQLEVEIDYKASGPAPA